MDNLSSHKGPRVTGLIQDCGAWLLFRPPSPSLKSFCASKAPRPSKTLWQAIGDICDLFAP
jgi:hypothetical protein